MANDSTVHVACADDIVTARKAGRKLAAEVGFGLTDQTLIATAISELSRNIVRYAGEGDIVISVVIDGRLRGIKMAAIDHGPGIADIELALSDGFSTSGALGLGLPGTRRLVDEFEIRSGPKTGTTVVTRTWNRAAPAGQAAPRDGHD